MKQTPILCDLAIIGAGAGGLSLAAGAAQLGVSVVLVESGKMGGDCLNYGCVPSKSLLAAAKAHWYMQQAHHFGIHPAQVTIDFTQVMQHVTRVIETIEVHDSVARFEQLGVRVIQASAHFLDRHTLQAGDHIIRAKHFVIATGSSPSAPTIPGLKNIHYYTNETIFTLTEQPQHLIVIGGGPVGCELAQAFAMLGSHVTLLESATLLAKDEPDCAAIVKSQLERTGITIYEGCNIQKISTTEDKHIVVHGMHQGSAVTITGTHLLIATGRSANVQSLQLEHAGIEYTAKGIEVDARLCTINKRIYAIGDVTGDFQLTHIANYHAGIVLKNILFKLPAKVDYSATPWVTYTDPELAHVGMTGASARQLHRDIQVVEWPFTENDRAQTEQQLIGKVKIITNKKARILGVTIVGPQAGELLLPWIIAIREKKTLRSFTDATVPYPTYSEISKRAAGAFYTPVLFSSKVRRIVKLLQRFSW